MSATKSETKKTQETLKAFFDRIPKEAFARVSKRVTIDGVSVHRQCLPFSRSDYDAHIIVPLRRIRKESNPSSWTRCLRAAMANHNIDMKTSNWIVDQVGRNDK